MLNDEKESELAQQAAHNAALANHLANKQTERRFQFFFSGLVFTLLSLAIQNPVPTNSILMAVCEVLGWFSLLTTGLMSLFEIGAFLDRRIQWAHCPMTGESGGGQYTQGLSKKGFVLMWVFFYCIISVGSHPSNLS